MNNIEVPIATKPKSIIVDGNLHGRFKLLCKGKSLKIGGVIENLMRLYLKDPKWVQEVIDEHKKVSETF